VAVAVMPVSLRPKTNPRQWRIRHEPRTFGHHRNSSRARLGH
jgi:hypothetical protein